MKAGLTSEDMFAGIDIDPATSALIIEWYKYRRVCNEERFLTYFRRILMSVCMRYNQQQWIDKTWFNPFITRYRERWLRHTTDETTTPGVTKTKSTEHGEMLTDTYNRTTHQEYEDHDDGHTIYGGTSDTTYGKSTTTEYGKQEHIEDSDNTKSLTGATPQSIMYGTGMPDELNWKYASGQGEQTGKSTSHTNDFGSDKTSDEGTDTVKQGGQDTVHSEGTNSGDITNTGDDTHSHTGTDTVTESVSGEDKRHGDNDSREIYRGWDNMSGELLGSAMRYLRGTPAVTWLVAELEPAFFAVYD